MSWWIYRINIYHSMVYSGAKILPLFQTKKEVVKNQSSQPFCHPLPTPNFPARSLSTQDGPHKKANRETKCQETESLRLQGKLMTARLLCWFCDPKNQSSCLVALIHNLSQVGASDLSAKEAPIQYWNIVHGVSSIEYTPKRQLRFYTSFNHYGSVEKCGTMTTRQSFPLSSCVILHWTRTMGRVAGSEPLVFRRPRRSHIATKETIQRPGGKDHRKRCP